MAGYRDIGAYQQGSGMDIGAYEAAEAAAGISPVVMLQMNHFSGGTMLLALFLLLML